LPRRTLFAIIILVAVWLGGKLRRWAHQRSYSTPSRVSTEMGDRLRVYPLGI